MNRILASLSITALLAVPAVAQNCMGGLGTPILPTSVGDDTIFTPHYALGFSFPVSGSALGSYTHCRINPNGWLILTDGTTTPAGTPTGYGSTTTLAGTVAGYAPRVATFWKDMTVVAPGAVQMDVTTNPGVSAKIVWKDTREYNVLPTKTYAAELFATGEIRFTYSSGASMNVINASLAWVGVSRGNGQTAGAVSDLSAGAATAGFGCLYQTFATGLFDMAGQQLSITPDGTGGWNSAISCISGPPATSVSVGTGCYAIPAVAHDSFYELFASAAAAQAALQGNTMTLTPVVSPAGYTATWTAGGAAAAYVAPGTAPASLGVVITPSTDDGTTPLAPSVPLSTPFGAQANLVLAHNGIISMGTTTPAYVGFTPAAVNVGTNTPGAFYSWMDFNDTNITPAPSGRLKTEEGTVGGDQVLFVTWDGVDRYISPAANIPSTVQIQLNLTTGVVTMVWVTVDPTVAFTATHLVGYSAPGVSALPAPITLATALPVTTFPDVPAVVPMALSVNVLPEIVMSGDTVPMTWTVTNVPEATQIAPMVRACNIVFSVGLAAAPAYDLGFILNVLPATPSGCNGYLFSADAFVDVSTLNGTGICTSSALVFSPPPSLVGLVLTTQAIAIAPAGVYAGSTNDIGGGNSLWSSNAVTQTYQIQ